MKPNIIFICQRFPYPPDRGDRITTWNFVKRLCQNYSVHLFCLTSEPKDFAKKEILLQSCASVHIYQKSLFRSAWDSLCSLLFQRTPISNAYYYSKTLVRDLSQLMEQCDIQLIYAYSSNMFGHIQGKAMDIPKIYHFGDVDSEKWKKMAKCGKWYLRPIYKIEYQRLRRWELQTSEQTISNVFATQQEADFFASIGGKGKIIAIPNGVDSDYFCPSNPPPPKENAIVFTGVMNYFPNVDTVLCFYREVYPLLMKTIPGLKFYIVGSKPTLEIQALSSDPNCIVTGYVPDVRPYLEKSKLFVAPMKVAQGMQNKILEALSMQIPVVTYQAIAHPLQLTEKQGVIPVQNPTEMAEVIAQLLPNHAKIEELGLAGRQAVLRDHRWESQLCKLDRAVQENLLSH